MKYFVIRATKADSLVPGQFVKDEFGVKWTKELSEARRFTTASAAMRFAGERGLSGAELVQVSSTVTMEVI